MICRLHGIPNEFHRPDGQVIHGPGCDTFNKQCHQRSYIPFDRTPFYQEMAALEKALRQRAGFTGKIKMTVAQMTAQRHSN